MTTIDVVLTSTGEKLLLVDYHLGQVTPGRA